MRLQSAWWMVCAVLLLQGCSESGPQQEEAQGEEKHKKKEAPPEKEDHKKNEFLMAQMQGLRTKIVTNYGEIELQFFPEKAPVHCFAFIIRAESGFYDGQLFHRVVPGFMIQGGDPNSTDEDPYNDGRGKPIVAIPHEFNDLEHTRGRLSMARVANVAIGAGSQFFILQKDTHRLDGNYTVFGEVVSGIDVVDQIAGVETEEKDPELKNRPVKPVVIQKMIVYTRP